MPEHCIKYSWFASMDGNHEPISVVEAELEQSAPEKIVDGYCEKEKKYIIGKYSRINL